VGGGISVAKMVNARPVDLNTQDINEKRFINVVEEMSIASGMAIPKLYIMDNEEGINAFVAGIKPDDTVMVATKGALTQLTREELQGVVGHEFSHIFNSDMRISLRLMGILGGIVVIGQLGFFILRIFIYSPRARRSGRSDDRSGFVLLILGLGLFLVGYIGLFFARLIKAAISRQRESLADASSVQYTRNPQGLVNALKRIQQNEDGTHLQTKHVEDISHLCFCPSMTVLLNNVLATHPPIAQRINDLDPDGIYSSGTLPTKFAEPAKEKKPFGQDSITSGVIAGAAILAANNAIQVNTDAVKQSIGNPTDNHLEYSQMLLAKIPPEIQDIAHDITKVKQIFYAFLIPSEAQLPAAKKLLSYMSADEFAQLVNLHQQILQLPQASLLPLVDIALPAFKANPSDKRNAIYQIMQQLVALERENLLKFMLLAIVGKAVADKTPSDTKVKYQTFEPVLNQVSYLMIFVMLSGKKDNPLPDQETFDKLMANFTTQKVSMPPINKSDPIHLQQILTELNLLTPKCKQILIHTCIECIESDKVITVQEAEVVRAIANCLDCPIPPILPTS